MQRAKFGCNVREKQESDFLTPVFVYVVDKNFLAKILTCYEIRHITCRTKNLEGRICRKKDLSRTTTVSSRSGWK